MLFSSLVFLFRFLPVLLIVYVLTPKKWKNFSLFIMSMIFYSWGEPTYFWLILLSSLLDFAFALGMDKYRGQRQKMKFFLLLSIFSNVFILGLFKYGDFVVDNVNLLFSTDFQSPNLPLPIGISFYTFQTMSYAIDVYRGHVKPEKNFVSFATFVTLFPQLVAGPIVKYSQIQQQLKQRSITMREIEDGIRLFIIGLAKKVFIANNIGKLWSDVQYIGFENISSLLAWLGILAFALQIYFDFSGYSLMAIGLGRMLGFTFPENFRYPYISRSISEFWRRWHMTLGLWFKEYVYIPLGGNRKHPIRNLFIVWFLTGFWHGASYNFILWGMFFFVLIVIEKKYIGEFLEKYQVLSHLYTLFMLSIGWSIFAIEDIYQLGIFLQRLFAFEYGDDYYFYLRNYAIIFVIALIASTPLLSRLYQKWIPWKWGQDMIYLLLFLVSVMYLVDATYNPFLYFRF